MPLGSESSEIELPAGPCIVTSSSLQVGERLEAAESNKKCVFWILRCKGETKRSFFCGYFLFFLGFGFCR